MHPCLRVLAPSKSRSGRVFDLFKCACGKQGSFIWLHAGGGTCMFFSEKRRREREKMIRTHRMNNQVCRIKKLYFLAKT